jgi:hypothetical protein
MRELPSADTTRTGINQPPHHPEDESARPLGDGRAHPGPRRRCNGRVLIEHELVRCNPAHLDANRACETKPARITWHRVVRKSWFAGRAPSHREHGRQTEPRKLAI